MRPVLQDLIEIANRHARGRRTTTAIPRVLISRTETPAPPELSLCEPAALFVLQGSKSVLIGDQVLRYDSGHHFVYTVETPVTGQVVGASADHPYLAIGFRYNLGMAAALLADLGPVIGEEDFRTHAVDADLLDAWRRMLRLLDRPLEIPVLAPMLEREILFRLLQGPQGARLRQHIRADGAVSAIRRTIAWIRAHYHEPLRVGHLAKIAHMSIASFHRHFKATTATSPIQYQKQIRLLEARQRLIARPGNITQVAFAVGYQSLSQFSREYARRFGSSPARDAARCLANSAIGLRSAARRHPRPSKSHGPGSDELSRVAQCGTE
jgi:AraC-like DNA-binding protein